MDRLEITTAGSPFINGMFTKAGAKYTRQTTLPSLVAGKRKQVTLEMVLKNVNSRPAFVIQAQPYSIDYYVSYNGCFIKYTHTHTHTRKYKTSKKKQKTKKKAKNGMQLQGWNLHLNLHPILTF